VLFSRATANTVAPGQVLLERPKNGERRDKWWHTRAPRCWGIPKLCANFARGASAPPRCTARASTNLTPEFFRDHADSRHDHLGHFEGIVSSVPPLEQDGNIIIRSVDLMSAKRKVEV
jgi:hypothetical protein